MKIKLLYLGVCIVGILIIGCKSKPDNRNTGAAGSPGGTIPGTPVSPNFIPSKSEQSFSITERGPHHRVWERTEYEIGPNGEKRPHVHRYTELTTGLHYKNAQGEWVESSEQIEILPQGNAAATQGQHQVYFPSDIYNGAIEVVTPDGKHLRSRPLGVSYDDGSNTVFIATLKHSQGYLTSSNQVTYFDAFTDFKADLVCTYRLSGFENDLVFRQRPPTPDQFGLDNSFSTIQLVTEFFNTADPEQITAASDEWYGLQDSALKFGKLTMAQGKALIIHTTNVAPRNLNARTQTQVYKRWLHSDNRTFLIEELPLEYIAADLRALPLSASIQHPTSRIQNFGSSQRKFPPAHEFIADTNQILLASANMNKEPGVVLDYNEINTDQTNFTFQSSVTYLVDGYVNLSGSVVFENGAVLKFWRSGLLNMSATTTNTFPLDSSHPVEFTCGNDDSVGQIISGSSGGPAIGDSDTFINFEALNATIRNCRFRWADCALTGWGVQVKNSEFVDLAIPINAGLVNLQNVLLARTGSPISVTANFITENVTAVCESLVQTDSSDWTVYLNNTLFTGSALISGYGTPILMTNQFFQAQESDFKTSYGVNANGAPYTYYLVTNSPYRNIGTTNVSSDLLAEIRTMTTYAPQDGSFPDTNAPDLGYHYSVNEDSDHDGLPDWWEWKYFGNLSQSAAGDYDGDRMNNYLEYVWGYNPGQVDTFADSDGDGLPDVLDANPYTRDTTEPVFAITAPADGSVY
jgi:hypothetical protein